MRFIPYALTLLFIAGCSYLPIYNKPETPSPKVTPKPIFLTPDEVVNQFTTLLTTKSFEYLDTDNLKTVDIDQFFPSVIIKNIDRRRASKSLNQPSYKGKGYVDLRFRDTKVVSQWDGTCSAHGLTAAIENYLGKPEQKLSERHVWSEYEKYSCDTAIETWTNKDKCITVNSAWDHDNRLPFPTYKDDRNCFVSLLGVTYIEDNIQKMIDALDASHPIYLGLSVTKSLMNCDSALNPDSKKTQGGHAMAVVGYRLDSRVRGGGYIIAKNSWGSDCGDNGYIYISFSHCERSDLYCAGWIIEKAIDS